MFNLFTEHDLLIYSLKLKEFSLKALFDSHY